MGWNLVPSFQSERRSFGSGVSKIWRNINSIWDQLNVELKNHDVNHGSSLNLSTTPTFYALTDIGLGITGGNDSAIDTGYRMGDKIRLKTCNVKINLANPNANPLKVRAFIVKHYENFDGVGPVYANIYDTDAKGYQAPTSFIGLRNNEHINQYKILSSRQIILSGNGTTDRNLEKTLNMFVKFKRKAGSYVEYDGGHATNDASNGKLYLVIHSDAAGTSAFDMEGIVTGKLNKHI